MIKKALLVQVLFIFILVPSLIWSANNNSSDVRLQENEWIRIIDVNKYEITAEKQHEILGEKTYDYDKGRIYKYLYVKILFLKYCKATTKENPSLFDDLSKGKATTDQFINDLIYNGYRYRCDYRTTVFAIFYDNDNKEIKTESEIPIAPPDKKSKGYKLEILPGEENTVIFSMPEGAVSWRVWVPK